MYINLAIDFQPQKDKLLPLGQGLLHLPAFHHLFRQSFSYQPAEAQSAAAMCSLGKGDVTNKHGDNSGVQ